MAAANSPDVYIGARETLGKVKLSLHPTMWRLAWVKSYAEANLPPEQDRLIRRWMPTPEIAPGWRSALFILVSSSLLGPPRSEKTPKLGKIAWWPDPGSGGLVSFKLLLGSAHAPPLLADPGISTVGSAVLSDQRKVHLVAEYGPSGDAFERNVEERRRLVAQEPRAAAAWGWSTTTEGAPLMIDTVGLGPNT